MYTDEEIENLMKCKKHIIDPPSKEYKEERGQLKKNFTLQSSNGEYNFNVFIRGSMHFKENFSIGMDYNPKEEKGTIYLIRCNGAHGENTVFPHHATFHIHKASAHTINNGLKPESNIEETSEYASLDEAVQFFSKEVNIDITDRKKYFPEPDRQIKLDL